MMQWSGGRLCNSDLAFCTCEGKGVIFYEQTRSKARQCGCLRRNVQLSAGFVSCATVEGGAPKWEVKVHTL